MSILNVNQIQPVGGGNTITVNASDVNFSGNISIGSSFVGTASTATLATISQGLTGTPDITVNNIQSGIVTATTFIGDGSGLTGVTASGSGINIKDSGSTVGVAATIDFSTNLNVSPASAGIVTVTVGDTDFEIADKIIHTGDTNTAIRFPADDTITAETGGSERLRITSTGSVGIGTISVPNNFKVEIANNGSTGLNLRNTNDSANDSCRIAFSQGSGNLASSNTFADIFPTVDTVSPLSGHIKFRTNGGNNLVERLRILSDGTVATGALSATPGTVAAGSYIQAAANAGFFTNGYDGKFGTSSNHPVYFQVNGSSKASISTGGDVTINNGDLILGTAGKGISFINAADTATGETVSSSVLDEYEEGTYAPVMVQGVTSPTYSIQAGRYTRIGNKVYVDFYIRFASGAANGSAIQIGGLPFTLSGLTYGNAGAGQLTRGGGGTSFQNLNSGDGNITFYGATPSNYFSCYIGGTAWATVVSNVTNLFIIGSFHYHA